MYIYLDGLQTALQILYFQSSKQLNIAISDLAVLIGTLLFTKAGLNGAVLFVTAIKHAVLPETSTGTTAHPQDRAIRLQSFTHLPGTEYH